MQIHKIPGAYIATIAVNKVNSSPQNGRKFLSSCTPDKILLYNELIKLNVKRKTTIKQRESM